ncbi:SRPBCC domain-containing protein [uncultured Nostoc sp.]|uniref:SRPBCC domain-containing protein n=1 Tax=uncultured Nostoc sp. TaxID=340711 RepID=UPI0035CB0B9A
MHDSGNDIEHTFLGEYREIVPPQRLIAAKHYEPVPNNDHLNTFTLTEQDGKTTLHIAMQGLLKYLVALWAISKRVLMP